MPTVLLGEEHMQQQEGIVIEVEGRNAKVKTSRHNDCENCGACPGNSAIVVSAYSPIQVRPGQRVIVEVQEINMLKAAFVVYVMPLLAIILGALAGYGIADYLTIEGLSFPIAGAMLSLLISIWYIKYYDYSSRTNEKMRPVITRIL